LPSPRRNVPSPIKARKFARLTLPGITASEKESAKRVKRRRAKKLNVTSVGREREDGASLSRTGERRDIRRRLL
jgi:hypothetical protein